MGRVVDRFRLRPMLAVTTFGEAAFWVVAPHLSYTALLVCGFGGGMLVLPAMSIGRQAIVALVPEEPPGPRTRPTRCRRSCRSWSVRRPRCS